MASPSPSSSAALRRAGPGRSLLLLLRRPGLPTGLRLPRRPEPGLHRALAPGLWSAALRAPGEKGRLLPRSPSESYGS
jgi:hypothetical protein